MANESPNVLMAQERMSEASAASKRDKFSNLYQD
jgi:hypothetical protein